MKKQSQTIFPRHPTGRLAGFVLLALIPVVTLVPVTSVPAWLVQDLSLRWLAAIVFLFCAAAYFLKVRNREALEFDFPDILVLLLTAWVLLSARNSMEPFQSFYAFKGFLALVLWWFSLRLIWRRWPGLFPLFEKCFYSTAVLAATWLVITTLGHMAGVPFFIEKFIPRIGSFLNENIAAGFLGMALIWAVLRRAHQQRVSLAALGVLLLAWGLTQSRGALVSMALVAVLYLLIHRKEIEGKLSKWNLNQWLVLAAGVVVVLVCLSFMIYKLFNSLDSDPRAYYRLHIWAASLKMIKAQFLMGFGPGTFQDIYSNYRPGSLWNTATPFAHNEYLQVAVECGLPALVLTLLILWVLFFKTGRWALSVPAFKALPQPSRILECAFYLLVFEAAHNFVDFTFDQWSHRLVLLAFVTYALKEKQEKEDARVQIHLSGRAHVVGAAVLIIFIIWMPGVGGLRDYLSRIYNVKGILLQKQGLLEEAESLAQKSLKYRFNYMDPWNTLGANEVLRAQQEVKTSAREKHFLSAERYFNRAVQLSPYSLTPRENQIEVMVKRGRLSSALDLEEQLIEKAPEIPVYYVNKANILLRMGRAKEAIAPCQKAIDLDNYFLPAYLLKAQAMEALGKKKDALDVYEKIQTMLKILGTSDPPEIVKENIQRLKNPE